VVGFQLQPAGYEFFLLSGFNTRILHSVATTKQPAHSLTLSFRKTSGIRPSKLLRFGE
jgi:hypothetical protein